MATTNRTHRTLPAAASATLLAAAVAIAQEARPVGIELGNPRAAISLHVAPGRCFVGQAVDVTLRVEFEEKLLREQLIQLFRQRTDVAARIDTPWARPLDGWQLLGPPPGFAGAATAVVDGSVATLRPGADVVRGEQRFVVFELVGRLVPLRAGALTVPRAGLGFAWASAFDEDFFGERVPADRRDERIATEPLEVPVVELPIAGRPRAFSGLVGKVTVATELPGAAAVRVGEGLSLRLSVTGDGDLRPLQAPAMAPVPSFHLRGVREEGAPGQRVFVHDLLPLQAGAHTLPAIAVSYFDPVRELYDVAASAPREVVVAPALDGTTAIDVAGQPIERGGPPLPVRASVDPEPPAPIPGIDVLFDLLPVGRTTHQQRPDFAAAPPLPPFLSWTLLLAPWLVVPGCWWLRWYAEGRQARARRRRCLSARRRFQRALTDPRSDRGAALALYLAAWLDCAPAAVVGPLLPRRLRDAGLGAALAHELDTSLDELAANRFGGASRCGDDASLLELVDRVDQVLRARLRAARRQRSLPHHTASGLLLTCALAAAAPAQQAELPVEAARHFAAGDVARAAVLYRQALEAGGFDAAALCFDLGNCAHRLGRPAEAVLWYERALRVAPQHFEARANLHLVRQQLALVDAGPRALLGVWIEGQFARIGAMSAGPWLAAAALLQGAGWFLWLLRRRRGAGGLLLVLGFGAAALAMAKDLAASGELAVVLRDGVRLAAEPHERAGAVGNLKAGESIVVLERSPRWARVRRGGDDGWIEARAFETVALRSTQ